MKKIKTTLLSIIIVTILLSINTSALEIERDISINNTGNVLYVGGTGPGNYTKIQDAIDDANPTDTIFVYNGKYVENLVINKELTLIGEDQNNTIIDGKDKGNTIEINADYVSIGYFKIIHSRLGDPPLLNNIGIRINSDHNVIAYNVITKNGDGILLKQANENLIFYNKIVNNKFHILTAGIGLIQSSKNIVAYNTISNNRFAGIHLLESDENMFAGNTIKRNRQGIFLQDSSENIVINNNFLFNLIPARFTGQNTEHCKSNMYDNNYWNRPRLFPKPIFGKISMLNGLMSVPIVVYDWEPLPELIQN